MRARLVLLAALAAATGSAANGQMLVPPPDAETVQRFSRLARDNLGVARLADGSPVPAETPAEREQPLISDVLAEQIVRRGFLSGELQVCNLDSDAESFLPFMQSLRASARHSDKQLAYVGLLHGVAQGFVVSTLRPYVRGCSSGSVQRLRRQLRDMPPPTP